MFLFEQRIVDVFGVEQTVRRCGDDIAEELDTFATLATFTRRH